MTDSTSSSSSYGLGELLALFGGANPFAGLSKSVSQFQRGVAQFLESVEKFNDTMEQLNQVSRRVNRLLDTVEEPLQALVPQVTRSIKTADALMEQLSGPLEMVAPGLQRLSEVLSTPAFSALPTNLDAFVDVLGDLSRRLQPLGQLAESAGTMFGLRPLAVLRGGGTRPSSTTPAPTAASAAHTATERPAVAPAKKAAPKKAAAKQSSEKSAAKKKAAPKKSASKKPSTKRQTPRKR